MPHIIIEYSNNLQAPIKDAKLLQQVHTIVTDSGLFDPAAVKARAKSYDDYILFEGAKNFLHITISILSGKSTEEKKSLSKSVFDATKKTISEVQKLSVDIHDMDITTYRK